MTLSATAQTSGKRVNSRGIAGIGGLRMASARPHTRSACELNEGVSPGQGVHSGVRRQGLEPRTRGLRVRCPSVCRGSGRFWPGDTDCPGARRTPVNCNQNCNCQSRIGSIARPAQDCPCGSRRPDAAMQDAINARRMAARGATACAPSLSWPVHSTRCRSHTRRTRRAPVRRGGYARSPLRHGRQLMSACWCQRWWLPVRLQDREARR